MTIKYTGLIDIDPSVLTQAQRDKMAPAILARMAGEELYDPETDPDPNGAAQLAYTKELLERSLLSLVKRYNKQQRVSVAQVDDPADEL